MTQMQQPRARWCALLAAVLLAGGLSACVPLVVYPQVIPRLFQRQRVLSPPLALTPAFNLPMDRSLGADYKEWQRRCNRQL